MFTTAMATPMRTGRIMSAVARHVIGLVDGTAISNVVSLR
jgi:hypothetical protein